MGTIGALNTFVAGTTIVASQVNDNFSDIRTAFNTYAVLTDTATTITVAHTFNPTVAGAPFTLGANALGQLVTGLNADKLDSQEGSYYQNADNISAGTLAAARLPSTVVLTDTARTIAAVHTFNPTVAGAPFILGANATGQLVTGLNADQLDGNEAAAFAAASHVHAGTDITTGTVPAARLPSDIVYEDSSLVTGARDNPEGALKNLLAHLDSIGLLSDVTTVS